LQSRAESSSDGWDDQVKERFHSGQLEQLYAATFRFQSFALSHVQKMRTCIADMETFWNKIKHFS
jgi:hypothetical protein